MKLLLFGGVANFGIAILHLAIIVIGVPAYLYFGAVELAQLAAAGSVLPALLTFILAFGFGVFGLYGLAGARGWHVPLLRIGLLGIGGLYFLRGLVVLLDVARWLRGDDYPLRQLFFSAVALGIGLLYLGGTFQQWTVLTNSKRS